MSAGAFRAVGLLTLCWVVASTPVAGQAARESSAPRDTVVVPGQHYSAGSLRKWALGDDYRDLWTTPVRVPFLDLERYAGGLTPIRLGGGRQTTSLRFRGEDGRVYTFRSVDKSPGGAYEPALEGTVIGVAIQDQTSSLHPTAALMVPPLLAAVGAAHTAPTIYVMPDHPRLGEFRSRFAGMLGLLEERPNELADGEEGFGEFSRVIGTPRLLERLEASSRDRIDAAEYLKVRLVDLVIGDWDRHQDQSRWGLVERDGLRYWVPIPRDRDYAFAHYDGAVMDVVRTLTPNAVRFDDRIRNLLGLTLNARAIDRHLLGGLDRAQWDSVTAYVRDRITDAVIDSAVLRVPPEHRHRSAEIAAKLKGRRDDLPAAADRFYRMLSTEVDLRATDGRDLALVERLADGGVDVRIYARDAQGRPGSAPYLARRLTAAETREVRLYLHGGDDHAVVRGDVERSVLVRVIGGGGDDVLVDSSSVRAGGAHTVFHDSRGSNQFVRGTSTGIDTDDYRQPPQLSGLVGTGYQDWGSLTTFRPAARYSSIEGLTLGGGPVYTRYGFRKFPHSYRLTALGLVGVTTGRLALDLTGDFRRAGSGPGGLSVLLSGSQLESIRFYGLGNETSSSESGSFYVVPQDRLLASVSVQRALPGSGVLAVGPIGKYTRSRAEAGSPFALVGASERVGQLGAHARISYDRRDEPVFSRNGILLQLGGAGYGWVTGGEPFGETWTQGSGFWTPRFAGAPTLALRAGAQRLWGEFPIHEAAFLGGASSVRGYRFQRFAGDGMAFGNAEIRLPLVDAPLIVRGRLGVHALADAGRVFVDGEDSDQWHGAWGGGVWFRADLRGTNLLWSATYARGAEEGRLYFRLGAPF